MLARWTPAPYSRDGRRLAAGDADGGSVPARLRRVFRVQVQLPRRPCSPGQPECPQAGAAATNLSTASVTTATSADTAADTYPAAFLAAVTLAAATGFQANAAARPAGYATPPIPVQRPSSLPACVRPLPPAIIHPHTLTPIRSHTHPSLRCVQKMGVIAFGSHDFAAEQQGQRSPLAALQLALCAPGGSGQLGVTRKSNPPKKAADVIGSPLAMQVELPGSSRESQASQACGASEAPAAAEAPALSRRHSEVGEVSSKAAVQVESEAVLGTSPAEVLSILPELGLG